MCSCLPNLIICRLPFDHRHGTTERSSKPLMTLPNLSDTNHLRTLTIGKNSSLFLKHLLSRIPFIENLSVGIHDEYMYNSNNSDMIT